MKSLMHCNESDSINAEPVLRVETAWKKRAERTAPTEIDPYSSYIEEKGPEVEALGKELLRAGKAACLIAAGGQGTRLGFPGPKGCLEVAPGLSIFSLFASKVLRASLEAGRDLSVAFMTSLENHNETVAFFKKHDYFGLKSSQVSFFIQGQLPILDDEGMPLGVSGPNGNGAALFDLYESGIARAWQDLGVEHVVFVQIDNPLADPFDPILLGRHVKERADATLKAILREDPEEKVGVVVKQEGKVAVVEYNEIDHGQQSARDAAGKLLHPCANISFFAFSMEFIVRLNVEHAWKKMPLHIAHKRIPQADDRWGNKFEYFIFDVLTFSQKTSVIVAPRRSCFSPIKDPEGLKQFQRIFVSPK